MRPDFRDFQSSLLGKNDYQQGLQFANYQGRQQVAIAFDQAENAFAVSPSTNTPASKP